MYQNTCHKTPCLIIKPGKQETDEASTYYLSLKHPEMEDVTHLLSNPYVLVWAVVFILLLLLSLQQLNKYNISDTNTTTEF